MLISKQAYFIICFGVIFYASFTSESLKLHLTDAETSVIFTQRVKHQPCERALCFHFMLFAMRFSDTIHLKYLLL